MGTYNSISLAPNNTTNAGFRSMGSTINSILSGIGLTQTSDTGQINWTTVNAPTGTNQIMGYEIWRFNDTLQSTAPIFMKFEYGSAGSNYQQPQIYLSLGTGSDGAGNITGIYVTSTQINYNNYSVDQNYTSNLKSNACYNTTYGVLWFSLWRNFQSSNNANMFQFYIGRSSDLSSGLPTGDGVTWGMPQNGTSSGMTHKSYVFSNGIVYNIGTSSYSVPASFTGLLSGGSQVWRPMGAYPDGRVHSWLGDTLPASFADGTTFSTALIGSTNLTFMVLYSDNTILNANSFATYRALLYQ